MKLNKEEMKAARRKLHKIYLDRDLPGFREFIKERSNLKPELVPYISASDDVLEELMINMKSQLIYLGPDWQEARNHLRYKQFWEGESRPIEEIPLCANCKYFREGPTDKEDPCMHLGATPSDISCKAFEGL